MNRRTLTASVLASAVGLAAAVTPASATMTSQKQEMTPKEARNMQRAAAEHLEKCYGINAIGKNDCAAGLHSCAGQAQARDPDSYVLLPAGDCAKIAGGSLKPGSAE